MDCPDSGHEEAVRIPSSVADTDVLAPDDAVAFRLHVDRNSMPCAVAPLWKMVGCPDDDDLQLQFGDYVGQLRYKSPQGHGFFDCPDIRSKYGHDPTLTPQKLEECGLQVGDLVAFTMHVDAATGLPLVQAPCWRCCSPAWGAEAAREAGFGRSRGDGSSACSPAAQAAAVVKEEEEVREGPPRHRAASPVPGPRQLRRPLTPEPVRPKREQELPRQRPVPTCNPALRGILAVKRETGGAGPAPTTPPLPPPVPAASAI